MACGPCGTISPREIIGDILKGLEKEEKERELERERERKRERESTKNIETQIERGVKFIG